MDAVAQQATGIAVRRCHFSTAGLSDDSRIRLWEKHNEASLIGLSCRRLDHGPLEAAETNVQLGEVGVAHVRANAHVVERTQTIVDRAPTAAIACYLTVAGSAFFYHQGGTVSLRPGRVIICDADRPFMRGFPAGLEELVVKLPKAALCAEASPAVRALSHRPLITDLVHGGVCVSTLARTISAALKPRQSSGLDGRDLALLVAGILNRRSPGTLRSYFIMARSVIEERLSDPALSARDIADAVGVSERHLSRAFADADTTIPQYILGRRLHRAYVLLDGSPETTIAQAAHRCGFGSATYFSHSFRQRFGVRATDVRRTGRAAALR